MNLKIINLIKKYIKNERTNNFSFLYCLVRLGRTESQEYEQ